MKLSAHQIRVLKFAADYEAAGISYSVMSNGIKNVQPLFRMNLMYHVSWMVIESRRFNCEYRLTDLAYEILSSTEKKTVFVCVHCGKETAGRLPNIGGDGYGRIGDGTFRYPRRHTLNGKDCPGNIMEARWVDTPINKI